MASTTSVSSSRPAGMRLALRVAIALLGFLVLIFVIFDFFLYRAVKSAMPQLDGAIAIPGLTTAVDVARDKLGVPTIQAANLHDLFFAQGYITAQDRLWQMDMSRRFASGDLSAVLGPEFVKVDREQRILGLRQVAEQTVARASASQRAPLDAYAAGVNAFIAQHQKSLPLEFRALAYFPHNWTPEDSVLVGLSMSEMLNHYIYRHVLEKEKILAQLGPELTADLFINTSWRDHPPGSEPKSLENGSGEEGSPDEEEAPEPTKPHPQMKAHPPAPAQKTRKRSAADIDGAVPDPLQQLEMFRPGSNDWVVSGAHTASGKPLLSNDMHLDLRIPNIWYEAHLTSGDFDVAGVTLPGIPFVIVGHNRHIAWGFTNVGPNVEDVYIEKFNDKGEYLTPQGWVAPTHRQEIIRVKGKPEVDLDVVTTRHGPIISDLIPGETRKLALKWIIYDASLNEIPFLEIDSARNWDEFRAALSRFSSPGQNVVYADIDGHIGYQATGRVPIRASGDGSLPEPGWDDSHEWTGYIPFDEMPRVYDPPSGILATANGRITPDGYPYNISIEWDAPFRTERIYKLLNAKKKLTPADMLAIQTDVVSEFDRFCAQRLVYAVDHAAKPSQRAKTAADLLRKWDGTMAVDSAAPTIVTHARVHLWELLLRPKLGDSWRQYHWFASPVWMENVLSHQPDRWLPPNYASFDDVLTAALEATVSEADAPGTLSSWRYGRVHRIEITHPIWGSLPLIKRAAGTGSQPLSGDGLTIKQVGVDQGVAFGPSERITTDFSNFDSSTLNLVNGQSGSIFSDNYNDQWNAYYHGTTFQLPFTPEAVRNSTVHHLKLQPQ